MRDLDGNSYGASATAFAYRKGLVNGCACRPMPWSDSERARHERYALLDAEQKLRVAEADTNRVAAAQAALLAKQAPRTDVQMAQAATPGTDEGPAVGPNEAALLAAQNRREASASAAPKPPRSNARGRSAAEADQTRTASGRTNRNGRPAPVRVATAPAPAVKPGLFGGGARLVYPGDH